MHQPAIDIEFNSSGIYWYYFIVIIIIIITHVTQDLKTLCDIYIE